MRSAREYLRPKRSARSGFFLARNTQIPTLALEEIRGFMGDREIHRAGDETDFADLMVNGVCAGQIGAHGDGDLGPQRGGEEAARAGGCAFAVAQGIVRIGADGGCQRRRPDAGTRACDRPRARRSACLRDCAMWGHRRGAGHWSNGSRACPAFPRSRYGRRLCSAPCPHRDCRSRSRGR